MEDGNEEKNRRYVSSLPEFAEIFLFLQIFGPLMKLSSVTLKALEDFFMNDDGIRCEEVAIIQWRLLRWAGKHGGKEEWQRMAVKFGSKLGLVSALTDYDDISVHSRMKIFQRSCEEQFDCNLTLRNNMSWDEPFYRRTKSVGVDRDGRRYWLLQDSAFNVHLYSDHAYADPPTSKSLETWKLLARSLNGLADHISLLESRSTCALLSSARSGSSTPAQESTSPEPQDISATTTTTTIREPLATSREQDSTQNTRKFKSKKTARKSSKEPEKVVGCLKCFKDVNYKKMLLCDSCDRECHTYCQYPVLWAVPKGEWQCPVCKEQQLLKELKQVYTTLAQAKAQHEQLLERQQRSVARLQKSGVLLQNILDDGAEEGRSRRRNRKVINYAELNDFYLPPLSPSELVGRESRKLARREKSSRSMFDYIQEDYLAPRVRTSNRRRFKGTSPDLDVVVEEEEEVGDAKEAQEYMKDGEEVEEEFEEEAEEEEEGGGLEEREASLSSGSGLSDHAAEQWPKGNTILGKRSRDSLYSDTDHTEHVSGNPLSSDSSPSSPHSGKCSDMISNGTPSAAEVTGVSECMGKDGNSREEESWEDEDEEEEEEEEGADFAPMQPWKETEVSVVLPQEFLHDQQHSKTNLHRTPIPTKPAVQSVSLVLERTNLKLALNPERD